MSLLYLLLKHQSPRYAVVNVAIAAAALFVTYSDSLCAQNHHCDSTFSPIEAGKRHFYRGEYLQAIEDYNKIPNTDPDYGDVLYEMAWAQYEVGDYLQSISLLSDAIYYIQGNNRRLGILPNPSIRCNLLYTRLNRPHPSTLGTKLHLQSSNG